ncbi:MAG: type II toxin-antitoxin system HipA family toxin, partial [Spirochaetota bacterium]|nr:type II toxin-antitoxin system HipA family toxin [Spirochaetota bacterium]
NLFADSLPDTWGKKVQDAEFEKIGRYEVSALERLAFIGNYGMGALQFKPQQTFSTGLKAVGLADLRKASQHILSGNIENIIEQLFRAGGSAGGSRPKYLVDLKNDESNNIRYTTGEPEKGWIPIILKVSDNKGDHWQRIEYSYFKMAELADIEVPLTWLLSEDNRNAHFATKRFDINKYGDRYHMQTFAGLLGINFKNTDLDYTRLLRTTADLCLDKEQVKKIYKLMVFNYLGSNKDDHAKNFSFLMDNTGRWYTSPAYDISYSSGEMGLHAMAALGKRRNLTMKNYEKIADNFDIDDWENIITKTKEALHYWLDIAKINGVPEKYIKNIQERIKENINHTR